MIISINDTCRIESDAYNWIIATRSSPEGGESGWKHVLFWRSLPDAIEQCVLAREKFATLSDIAPYSDLARLIHQTENEIRAMGNLNVDKFTIETPAMWFAIKIGLLDPAGAKRWTWTFMTLAGGLIELLRMRMKEMASVEQIRDLLNEVSILCKELPASRPWGCLNSADWNFGIDFQTAKTQARKDSLLKRRKLENRVRSDGDAWSDLVPPLNS